MDYRRDDQQQRQQLLTVVDRGTIEELFTYLQGFHRRPFQNLGDVMVYNGVIDDEIDFIDCTGTKYNVTPLIIAAGKGSYEKTKILLVHGANPNKQCVTGDTALNLAVHRQKYLIVDLLLQYHANPNLYNQAGKTALHRAVVAYNDENINRIRTLLDAGADPNIEDRNQRLPLDEAVMANRPEVVDILLSHNRNLIEHSYRAAIIASRLGHVKCLETLLNYGLDPNITDQTNTTPLHVAVRSLQLSTVQLLIANGADQNIANNRGETAFDIVELLQPDEQQNFRNVLTHTPQTALSDFHSNKTGNAYPLLRSHPNWTLDSDEFRSQTAPDSSTQNLLDMTTRTSWCCTQSKNAWIIFDLKREYNITGIRIIGCENQSTPKNGHLDVSNALIGPWLKVKDFTCLLTEGNKNDFFFPSLKTRFIRVFILDNYDGKDIQIQGIGFFGVEMRLIHLLEEYGLEKSLNTLLANGINDQETLDENQDEILNSSDKYLHVNDHFQFIRLTESLKPPQLTFLEWFNPPQSTVIAGEKFQTFSVTADEGVTDRIKLEEKLENSPQATMVLMKDLEPIQGHSLVDFPDYTIKNPGRYQIRVVSVESPDIHTSWQQVVVGPTLSYAPRLNTVADEQLYLSSTTRFYNDTTSDKENTLRSQKELKTTLTKKENRAFITEVYESENDDTENDTHFLSIKSVSDSPYYFPLPEMSYTTDTVLVDYQPEHYTQTKVTDYYDHSTITDEDDDADSNSSSGSNSKSKRDIVLTPTKYRSKSRPPLTNIFPNTNGGNQEQPNEDEELDYGDKIIIPTKYRLQQDRIKKLLNGGNTNRPQQQSQIQIEQQRQNQDELEQELRPQQQSHYHQRQQSRQQNGSTRESLSERPLSYHSQIEPSQNQTKTDEQPLQRKQSQNQNTRVRNSLSPPPQQSNQQNGSERESLPPQSHYYEIDQSQKRSESIRQSPVRQKQSQYHQQERLQNPLPPQNQQQSNHDQRQQTRQQNGSARELSPEPPQSHYHELEQSQKRNEPIRETSSRQQQSRQQNNLELGTPPPPPSQLKQQQSRKQNELKQDPSDISPYYDEILQLQTESDEEPQVHLHQQQLPKENIDHDHSKSFYNRYQIISGDFELRQNPSDRSLYTYEPKHTQMQLVFKATLQGPEVQERARNSIQELTSNRSHTQSISNNNNNINKTSYPNSPQSSTHVNRRNQNTTDIISNHEREYQTGSNQNSRLNSILQTIESPTTTTTKPDHNEVSPTLNYPSFQPLSSPNKPIKRLTYDDNPSAIESNHQSPLSNQFPPSNITTHNANDNEPEDIHERSRSSSQNYISPKYVKNPLKRSDNTRSSLLVSSPKSSPTSLKNKTQYYFGENAQMQSSDEDSDETICETMGHNSQPRPLLNTDIRRNFDYPSTTNSRSFTNNNNNNYTEQLQFGKQSDVATTTGNSLTHQQPQHSSSTNQSTVEKIRASSHDSRTYSSNKQIPPQGDYEASDAYPITNNYSSVNQHISNSTVSTNAFQEQYQVDSDHYEQYVASNIKQEQPLNKLERNRDDEHQPQYEEDDHDHVDDDDDDDYPDDGHNIHDQTHDHHDNHNYHNDVDEEDEDDNINRDDDSHHPVVPRPPVVDTLFKQKPVRDTPTIQLPVQYPLNYPPPLSQQNIYTTKNKNKGGFFDFLKKDKKTSKQKSNQKAVKLQKR